MEDTSDNEDFDEVEDLESQIAALSAECESISQENTLFQAYYSRCKPANVEEEEDGKDAKGKKKGVRNDKTGKKTTKAQTLTIEQKLEIATSELDEIQKGTEESKRVSERLIDTLKAVIEETDIKIAELRKDAYEFKRDVVIGAENFRTGKTMAEKVIRYMEEKLRQKDAVIEKLRLKNATLKNKINKVEGNLKQKEEMGDVLHYIDFHQLQIENKQYVAKIEERNQDLLKLKMTTGNTVQVLNNLKRKLGNLIAESEWLKNEMKSRTTLLSKIKEENSSVEKMISRGNTLNESLKTVNEESTNMPQVLDYVKQKSEMYELQAKVRNWERKVEIAKIATSKKASTNV